MVCVLVIKVMTKRPSSLSSHPSPSSQQLRKMFKMGDHIEFDGISEDPKMPENWPNLSSDQKLDMIMAKVLKIDQIEKSVNDLTDNKKNDYLALKVKELEGKNVRLEKKLTKVCNQLEDLQCREMSGNLIFSNIMET